MLLNAQISGILATRPLFTTSLCIVPPCLQSTPSSPEVALTESITKMEAFNNKLLFCYCLLAVLSVTTASSLFRDLISDVDVCEDVCQKTYPAHTYDKVKAREQTLILTTVEI